MDLAKAARDPWVWGQLALFLLIGLWAPLLPRHVNLGDADFMLNRIDPAWIRGLGVGVLLLGAVLFAWGIRSLGRSLTPGTEPLPDAELVTAGAYNHVRHPIYSGLVLALTGYTLAWSNWTLAVLFGFLALKYFQAKASREEDWLVERFPGYKSYMRRVPRRVL
jgi:protein-S-isoprenylcysteine O-methyltransferase Ste14